MQDTVVDPHSRRYQTLGTTLAVMVYLFLLAPIIVSLPMAFGPTNAMAFPPQSYSLDLFRLLFQTPAWMDSLAESFKVALAAVAISMVAGVPAGYWIARHDFPGKKLLTGIVMSPLVIPHIVLALGLFLYFSYLRIATSTASIILGHLTITLPYVIIVIIAGVNKLDRNLEFGAELMGAGPIRMFFTVVLPQLVPSLLSAALFSFLLSFDEITISWFLAGPGTTTLPVQMYSALQWELSPLIAAAAALLTAASLVISILAIAVRKDAS